MNRLEIAKRKLNRLEEELLQTTEQLFANANRTNGQPLNDKRNKGNVLRRDRQITDKGIRLHQEIEKQKERIETLERQAKLREQGWNKNGNGMRLSIDNIENIRKEIDKSENGNGQLSPAQIRKYKKEIVRLDQLKEDAEQLVINKTMQAMINSGELTQWKKQPTIFFIKKYRKTALELNTDGTVRLSERYCSYDEEINEKIITDYVSLINN